MDASNRDNPVIRSDTPLAWTVDRVFVSGSYLLELDRWGNSSGTIVRVALAESPETILNVVSLTNLPFLGAAVRGNLLYVAQGRPAQIQYQWDSENQLYVAVSTNSGTLSLTVVDLIGLPALTVVGQTQVPTADEFQGEWQALWPKPGLLVWKSTASYYLPLYRYSPVADFAPGGMISIGIAGGGLWWPGPWWGGGPLGLIAFDVTEASEPKFVSHLKLANTQGWGEPAQAYAANGLVYSSHREYETLVTGTNYVVVTNLVSQPVTNILTVTNIVSVPQYTTVTNTEFITNLTTVMVLNRPGATVSWQWPDPAPLNDVLAAGGAHSLLVDPSRVLWAWGANSDGQLGSGAYSSGGADFKPVPGFTNVRFVTAGAGHTLALNLDGTVWAWGAGSHGQLGNGLPPSNPDLPPLPYLGSPSPVPALGLSNIVSVAAGFYHSLALSADGSVWGWGPDWTDPLKNGSTAVQYIPKIVPGLGDVGRLAAGLDHSLAVKMDRTVWAWGRNAYGQLGNGKVEFASAPVAVAGLSDVVAVAAGIHYSLALKADGTVWGWGSNREGSLGGADADTVTLPRPIAGLGNIMALSAGRDHNLALKADGTVWAWGENGYGQLGDGIAASAGGPARVAAFSNAVAVAAGRWFSLALTADGSVWAWGRSDEGQLGNGLRYETTRPLIQTNISFEVTYVTETNILHKTNVDYITRNVVITNESPIVITLQHHYLDVVDYALPAKPLARPPVNIPGTLQGISHGGALLYTMAFRPGTEGAKDFSYWLDASAYDGVEAHWVDSLSLSNQWTPPVLVHESVVYLGRPATDTNSAPQLEAWTLPNTGKFAKLASAATGSPVQKLAVFGGLLAAQDGYAVQLFDVRDPAVLKAAGAGGPEGCVYYNLDYSDGSVEGGLWLPLGEFGVVQVRTGL